MKKKSIFNISVFAFTLSLFACNNAQVMQQQSEKFTTKSETGTTAEQPISPFSSEEIEPKPSDEKTKSVPDTTAYLNLVTNSTLRKAKMGNIPFPARGLENMSDFSVKTCCGTGKLHWGARIKQVSGTNIKPSVYAKHKVNLSQTFPTADTLIYSPTLLPPNNSPVEVSTVYYRPPGSSSTMRYFGVWDHTKTSNNWIVWKDMSDSVWNSKYTLNLADGKYYYVQIRKTSSTVNTWTVQLYNFVTGLWEDQSPMPKTFTGGSAFVDGWDFHEPKFDDICPALEPIRALAIQVNNGSGWYNNDTAHGATLINGSSKCPNWTLNMVNNYYNWKIN